VDWSDLTDVYQTNLNLNNIYDYWRIGYKLKLLASLREMVLQVAEVL